MRDIVLTIIIFGTIPFILSRPYIGILVFSWIGYMNPHRLTWGFAYNMPFAAIIGGLTLLLLPFAKEKGKIPTMPLTVVWYFWIAWMNISSLFSVYPENFDYEWSRAVKIQLVSLVTIVLLQSREKITQLIWVLVLSIGYYSVKGGLFTLLTGGSHIVFGPPGTFFEGNNALAVATLMILPLMRFLQTQVQNPWLKHALTAMMLLSVFAVIASYSRGAFLA